MELVCPAGTPAALRAAVDSGGHAVYCGFADETNARNFPGLNFSREELAAGVAYAHERGARVLVAINTFPRAGALPLWHRALADAEAAGADAVILADLGLLAHAAEHHSGLRRHLSVQAAAANADTINFHAETFGVKRVVLPRVLSVSEIAEINREIDIETEVFVFGGLCVMAAQLIDLGLPVEVNDLTALAHIPEGTPLWVGPLVNVYNEGTLGWPAGRGATRVCLPPELPLASIATMAAQGARLGLAIEVWGHGRLPLAIAGRCYHARLHGRSKDKCRLICGEDPDGREVDTLDGQPFLAVNGVQTLSSACASAAHQIGALREAGVSALRMSPQTGDFAGVCAAYRDRIAGQCDTAALVAAILPQAPSGRLSDGFLTGGSGIAWSGGA